MRLLSIEATVVSVPTKVPIRWSWGIRDHVARVVYELTTDQGITGLGESYFEPDVLRLLSIATEELRDIDLRDTTLLHARLDRLRASYETTIPAGLRAGIEMACFDAVGKAGGRSVASLLGGVFRDRVEAAGYLFYQQEHDTPEHLAYRAEELVEAYGFHVLKAKGGVHAPTDDVRLIRLLAERFPAARLRLDPNAAWSVGESLEVAGSLEAAAIRLEYLEDPTDGIAAMARLRQRLGIPLATNMCVVSFEHLAPAITMGAVDIVLADPHYWGGLSRNLRMIAVCDAFGLAVGMHSDNDLGISTAAKIHLAAACPSIRYAIDSHHPEHEDDLIVEALELRDGFFTVPTAPGLGVELDRDAVARYAQTSNP